LQDKKKIANLCKFDIVAPAEHVFQISTNKWLISSPENFHATIKCENTFNTIQINQAMTATVPPGCKLKLKTHLIDPDTTTVDEDLEAIHYEWIWKENEIFHHFHLPEFSETIQNSLNSTSLSIDFVNTAVSLQNKLSTSLKEHQKKSVEEYLQDIKQLTIEEDSNITHPNTTLIIVIIICCSGLVFFLFKLLCTSNHRNKPLFPTYRMREWSNRRLRHQVQDPIGSSYEATNKEENIQMNSLLKKAEIPKPTFSV
jgi:hypothetical protein